MMTMVAMHMPVLDFLRRRRPDIDDAAVESEPLACPGMIAVEHGFSIGNVGDREDEFVAVACFRIRFELKAISFGQGELLWATDGDAIQVIERNPADLFSALSDQVGLTDFEKFRRVPLLESADVAVADQNTVRIVKP